MTINIPVDHHFTPIFYLKTWADAGGRVTRYSRPLDQVVAKSCAPRRTGSSTHLYTMYGVPPERQAVLETEFFRPVDDQAAIAHQMLLAGRVNDLTGNQRCHWARFMMSMTLRSPFSLGEVQRLADQAMRTTMEVDDDEFNAIRKSGDPGTLYEWTAKHWPHVIENAHKTFLPGMIDHPDLGQHLINMVWDTLELSAAVHGILTSDRPFTWAGGWKEPKALLVFPLGPTQIFVAANSKAILDGVRQNAPDKVVKLVNEMVVRLAVDFVIGHNDSQLRFIENRLRRLDEAPVPGPIGRGQPGCPA